MKKKKAKGFELRISKQHNVLLKMILHDLLKYQPTNIYDKTILKWIHRFNNDYSVKGIFAQMDYCGIINTTDKARNEILRISSTNPREIGLKFSTWSLRSIAGYVNAVNT